MSVRPAPLPKLLDGEKIVEVKEFDNVAIKHTPSALKEIERLTRAKKFSEIGKFGPAEAAETVKAHGGEPAFHIYEALFGRDSLQVAYDLLPYYPALARSTLIKLAELQGVSYDSLREEEPGRIVHEVRDPRSDPVARKLTEGRGWQWPYYGAVDTTVEFVRTLVACCRSSEDGADFLNYKYKGRDKQTHTMLDALQAAVEWTVKRLDTNEEGLLEFRRSNPGGIENQVWKDSWDAYCHADGTMANHQHGIASIEVQCMAADAMYDAADIYETFLNKPRRAEKLRWRAYQLRQQIIKNFWVDGRGGYFALGTDRDDSGKIRRLEVRTSNMGHVLRSKLLMDNTHQNIEMEEAIIGQLFSPELLSISGIRTLATNEVRFRPGSYHNGSVWIWDNYLIAQGLAAHGYFGLAHLIEQLLLDDIRATRRFPEYLRGDTKPKHRLNSRSIKLWDEHNQRVNLVEQPPQDVQAWSVSAILAIKLERRRPVAAIEPRKRALERRVIKNLTFRRPHGYLSLLRARR